MKVFTTVFEGEIEVFDKVEQPISKFDDSQFGQLAKSGDYLPRLQLLTANSDKCKSGEFPTNHYALIRDQAHIDLGTQIDVLVCAWRPMALDSSGDDILVCYDPKPDANGSSTGLFKQIEEKSEQANSMCMFGHQYLVWIPNQGFATFFMGTKSARRESPNVKARMRNTATLRSQKIETKRFTWFAPQCLPCTTPLSSIPDAEELNKQMNKFMNPPEQEVELAKDDTSSRER